MIKLIIPGVPVPQGRPRFGKNSVYDPQKSRDYKAYVGMMASNQMHSTPPMKEAARLTVKVYRPIPKSFSKKKDEQALSYKECCIIKHALRDKPDRNCAEEMVYKQFSALVKQYKEILALWDDNRTAINHEPVPHGSRNRILK